MKIRRFLTTIIVFSMFIGCFTSCKSTAKNKEYNNENIPVANLELDLNECTEVSFGDETKDHYLEFAFNIFNECSENNNNNNLMISPASIFFALGMAAGGARDNTLEEMTNVLCPGSTPEELQSFAVDYFNTLNSYENSTLRSANALWLNESILASRLNEDYVDFVEDNYDAEVNSEEFSSNTVTDINNWVDDVTDGMIKKVLNDISMETALIIVNAVAFEAEWAEPYEDYQVQQFDFNGINGTEVSNMLCETTNGFYQTELATGFKKAYSCGEYYFVAILPNNSNADINEFASDFSAEDYNEFINSWTSGNYEVLTRLPEFSFDYHTSLNEILSDLGMNDAFNPSRADFGNIAEPSDDNLFISSVLHDSHIELDRNGTRAAAVTTILVDSATAFMDEMTIIEIYLDRPFMFVIMDTNTNLPLFIGTVNHISE